MKNRKSKYKAPTVVYFVNAKDENGVIRPCVYAECTYAGTRIGPIWGHLRTNVQRALATLTKKCDCGRTYHKHQYTEGRPIRQKDVANNT